MFRCCFWLLHSTIIVYAVINLPDFDETYGVYLLYGLVVGNARKCKFFTVTSLVLVKFDKNRHFGPIYQLCVISVRVCYAYSYCVTRYFNSCEMAPLVIQTQDVQ